MRQVSPSHSFKEQFELLPPNQYIMGTKAECLKV